MRFLLLQLSLALILGCFASENVLAAYTTRTDRKIIVFNGTINQPSQRAILREYGIHESDDLNIISAQSTQLSQSMIDRLRQHPGIVRIDDDVVVSIERTPKIQPVIAQQQESIPWGITRIHAPEVWPTSTGNPVSVGVIDTGIDLTHPDLASNVKGSYNAIVPSQSAADDNGHGTHIAGIIGAIDNTSGVVGVGPDIDLYAIKVLDRRGSGYLSTIIKGIDWALSQHINILNLSFGTSVDVPSLHDAIIRARQAGAVIVAAAGNNNGGGVLYPAAYSEAIGVSAISQNDQIAPFSSQGNQVDIAAPGENILSTFLRGSYRTLSGTSMATPHVTGAVAIIRDRCSSCTVDEITNRLLQNAEDRGSVGLDSHYGYGVVNVKKALGI